METVRHAEGECRVWHEANTEEDRSDIQQDPRPIKAVCFQSICVWLMALSVIILILMVVVWVWWDELGKMQLMETIIQRKRMSPLHAEREALKLAVKCMLH